MANSKGTALTANTTPALTDVIYIIDDPSGTAASQKCEITYVDSLLRAADMAYVATANKAVANTGAETSIIGTGSGSLTLAANYLSAGRTLRVKAAGFISETGTPTLNIKFKLGATVICETGAVTLPASLSNSMLSVDVLLTSRTPGASGAVIAQGYVFAGSTIIGMVATATSTVDTTGTLALDVTATWGVADPANTLTCTNFCVRKEN
jgi:hypothetical protein